MRVYLPLTVSRLRAAVPTAQFGAAGEVVFAVTDGLRAEYPGADDDELEYLAMADAARASLRLLAAEDGPDWLRVVLAADVEGLTPASDLDRAAARLGGTIPWKRVASVHIDGADAAAVVQEAAGAVDAADLGDIDAEYAVGSAEDLDLAWYGPGEVRFLLEDLS
ncbi:hypothetical protein GIS00_03355 [Nakamurella sp. YIM 132087]|uniref:Uncharacterized protein n=1 Tax=Nakamurella alba TaxID=2665158 RepID=A0A7K1FFU8_9ACTN|nr:hypothetical protein [Nakamurella alba]MTD12982.1 hypothetical protein [Nakamurella alba]